MRHANRDRPLAVVILVAALLLVTWPMASPEASAQVPDLNCLNCDVTLSVLEWNGTGAPGTIVGGTVRVENSGESTDSYTITVNASQPGWTVETEHDNTGDVPPGAGLLAEDDNHVDIGIMVLIPEGAAASAEAGVTITATSDNAASLSAITSAVATAAQTYGWQLTCTNELAVQKSGEGNITLAATNTGNGPDSATIRTIGINGLSIDDPEPVTAAAGATAAQDLDIGVGLSLEDGDYTLRWNLTSTKSRTTSTTCVTTIAVTGGTSDDAPTGGNESEDSPGAPVAALLVAAAIAAARTRRRD